VFPLLQFTYSFSEAGCKKALLIKKKKRNGKRNLLVLLYLRRKYKKCGRQYWIQPILAVRYLEGSFYTLFEKLKNS